MNGEIVKESGKSEGSTRTTKAVQATAQEALYFMPDKARNADFCASAAFA